MSDQKWYLVLQESLAQEDRSLQGLGPYNTQTQVELVADALRFGGRVQLRLVGVVDAHTWQQMLEHGAYLEDDPEGADPRPVIEAQQNPRPVKDGLTEIEVNSAE